jgi:hypothetical protein
VREANQAALNRRALPWLALLGGVEKLLARATAAPDRSLRKVPLATIPGIRRKLKPFSSVAVFLDQDRANPIPGEGDAPAWPDGPLSAGELKAGILRWLEEAA